MADDQTYKGTLGPNAWLVDEMFEQYTANHDSVSETWQEFFSDYVPPGQSAHAPPATVGNGETSAARSPAVPSPSKKGAPTTEETGELITGVAARIVKNMESSLSVPTATSYREVPAKLLEINRSVINGHLGRTRGGKVSFTHIIGYAIVRAISDAMPQMNSSYHMGSDGKPRITRSTAVGLGLAVDIEKSDGSRSLLVPCIRDAGEMDFAEFTSVYNDLIRRAMKNRLTPDDFVGATVTLTNPGTIGTERSVPRLMPGQGVIVGVGSLALPTEFAAADPHTVAHLGISKVMTISSTYDHRIIQGAESGLFLKHLHDLLLGEHGFYEQLFASMGVPYTAVQWRRDVNPVNREETLVSKQMQVANLINMYRVRGHLIADLDPLSAEQPQMHMELDPATYGLTIWDLDREFLTGLRDSVYAPVGGVEKAPLGQILAMLRDAYCRTVGIEYTHIQDTSEKRWIQEKVEGVSVKMQPAEQRHILDRLNAASALEKFLATKWMGQKRFGLEGAESAIPILDSILDASADLKMSSAVMGMAHRGRLNVLVNILGKNYHDLFAEFEGYIDPESIQGGGDVKYHLGQTGVFTARSGNSIPVELAANPSHLEAVDPVVEGIARARMDQIPKDSEADSVPYPVLPILLHGDAAFAGQGVVAETLNLSLIKGYRVGGTIHLIINNQLGFTTAPHSARSSEYCTDVAKTVQAPIFHVNGDDPEACVRVARLALEYRQTFNKDVVIDMVCYRRHGHNEGDDPSYTQPGMYRSIDARRSVRKLYTESLVRRGDISLEDAEAALADFNSKLQTALEETRESAPSDDVKAKPQPPAVGVLPPIPTGADRATIDRVYGLLTSVPDGFTIHPKLKRQFDNRDAMFTSGEVDWALAETLAFGSLLADGTSIRLAGQDSRRGTFSHRHSTLVDYEDGDEFVPLTQLETTDTKLWIYDSLLSEYAALGFEYGYSISNPDALVIWEAQFGDFFNGAQIIIDQFIVAAEDKWGENSGLVMLLPHGYEGQGPEHSSARIERFLILAAEDNIQICNASSAAQYFHLLRRQVLAETKRPLIIFTPKSGLRSRSYRSSVDELLTGSFRELIADDGGADPESVTRLILASGKVVHEAIERRDASEAPVAVARVEQLFPWPYEAIDSELKRFPNCREIVWLQEEPENMGPWNAIKGRLYEAHGDAYEIRRVSRPESGSPATGKAAIHRQEQTELLDRAFASLEPRDGSQFHWATRDTSQN